MEDAPVASMEDSDKVDLKNESATRVQAAMVLAPLARIDAVKGQADETGKIKRRYRLQYAARPTVQLGREEGKL